jgi:hypothetical protein
MFTEKGESQNDSPDHHLCIIWPHKCTNPVKNWWEGGNSSWLLHTLDIDPEYFLYIFTRYIWQHIWIPIQYTLYMFPTQLNFFRISR